MSSAARLDANTAGQRDPWGVEAGHIFQDERGAETPARRAVAGIGQGGGAEQRGPEIAGSDEIEILGEEQLSLDATVESEVHALESDQPAVPGRNGEAQSGFGDVEEGQAVGVES